MQPVYRLELLLKRLERRAERLDKISKRYSTARLCIFIAGAAIVTVFLNMAYSGVFAYSIMIGAGLVFLSLFAVAALKHEQVEKARTRLFFWLRIKQRHLARLKLDWGNLPYSGLSASKSHPFAIDLDITGPRSLLHLLDTTTSIGGRQRLEAWLLGIPNYKDIPVRQRAVQALLRHRRFRDRLSLHGLIAAKNDELFDYSVILDRSRISDEHSLLDWRGYTLIALAALNLVLIGVHLAGGPMWWIYSVFLYWAMYGTLISRVARHIEHLFRVNRALSGLFRIMIWIKDYRNRLGPELTYLWGPLNGSGDPARFKKRLARLDSAITFSQSDITRLIANAIVPYDFFVVLIYEIVLKIMLPWVEKWIEIHSELEALGALATYADFHSDRCTFPVLRVDDMTPPKVQGTALTHPLMYQDVCIPNDVSITEGDVGVITGSNMSGKSTYLRSVGLASLMAWAGGPVCAAKFEVSPLRIYTSMRIGDVLQEGKSTFYAEVERLSIVINAVDEKDKAPVLVLLDEILRGTNTKERLTGVRSIVTHLADAKALSFIATHDQEITHLAEEHTKISNYHFRERLDKGRLVFEYVIHDGPSDTTNALLIMQKAGLPIEDTLIQ